MEDCLISSFSQPSNQLVDTGACVGLLRGRPVWLAHKMTCPSKGAPDKWRGLGFSVRTSASIEGVVFLRSYCAGEQVGGGSDGAGGVGL